MADIGLISPSDPATLTYWAGGGGGVANGGLLAPSDPATNYTLNKK